MIRFVGFATQEEFHPVWIWLNDVMPGGFTIVEVEDEAPTKGPPIYWEEVYIREKSDAALFKLTWCGAKA